MKKILFYSLLSMSLLTSCNNGKLNEAQQEIENQKALNEATKEELQAAINQRDELLDLVNGITANVEEIKNVEKIITINGTGEGSKAEITNNIEAIRATLADRREKLARLEAKLKDSSLSNSKLLETIENLRNQIASQEQQIQDLTASLDAANRRIGQLGNTVDSLHVAVNDVRSERDAAREEAVQQANLANECYYAIGTKKELKEHKILESGFLRKTKVMQNEFDKAFFTKADKRSLTQIQLHSTKAKLVTEAQPKGSYEIVDVDGQKVLRILNPAEFWGTSNFVVIQID